MAPNQFWNSSALEPKRQHRWLITFGSGISAQLPSYIARSVDKPSFEINEAQHKYFGHTFKYPGQVTWNDVSMTLVDPVNPDATKALYDALNAAGYEVPEVSVGDALYTVSKQAAVNAIGPIITIEQLTTAPASGDPEVIEKWQLWNPWIKNVEFGNLSYEGDDVLEISLTLAYDFAKRSDR